MSRNNISGRWVIGIALLVIGALLFLKRVNPFYFDFPIPWWVFSWQMVLIVIGIILLLTTNNRTSGLVLAGIGVFFIIPHWLWWPLLLIGIGGLLLSKGNISRFHSSAEHTSAGDDPDFLEVVTIFGGCNKVFNSQNFKGGNIVALFGGSEIILHGSVLADGINVIEITTIFGGSSLILPSDWNVQIDVTPIFGGANDKRFKDPNRVMDNSKVLLVKGTAIFGGIEIKN